MRPECITPLLIFHYGLAADASRPPCAPRALVYELCQLEICPPYSKTSYLALFSSTMPLSIFSLSQWLSFGSKQIYIGFERVGFNFFFFENPLYNVYVLHFLLTLKHSVFPFFFEILALMIKFLAFICGDCVTGPLALKSMTASENVNWRFLENFVIVNLVWLFFKTEFWRRVDVSSSDDEAFWTTTI